MNFQEELGLRPGVYIGTVEDYIVVESFLLDLEECMHNVIYISIRLENGEFILKKIPYRFSSMEELFSHTIENDFDRILGQRIAFQLVEEDGELNIKKIFSPEKLFGGIRL